MNKEIRPNFTSESSRLAEERIHALLEIAKSIGVEIYSLEDSKEKILEEIEHKLPQRYELVVQKLREEGLFLSDLSKEAMLDRLLGIDILFRFEGKTYAVDVTSGKSSVVVNKQRKFKKMEEVYKQLGINQALVIRLKEDITEDIVLDLFSKLEGIGDAFTITIKYPEIKEEKKQKK